MCHTGASASGDELLDYFAIETIRRGDLARKDGGHPPICDDGNLISTVMRSTLFLFVAPHRPS